MKVKLIYLRSIESTYDRILELTHVPRIGETITYADAAVTGKVKDVNWTLGHSNQDVIVGFG